MDTNASVEAALRRLTQIDLVSSTTAAGTLYGIAFVLYCLYLHVSLPQLRDHDRRRQAQFMITNSTIIMICGLYSLIMNTWVQQDAIINHSDFPGGPFIYEGSSMHSQPMIPLAFLCQIAISVLTVAIQIWRLWVVWSGIKYFQLVVVVPLLCLLGFTAFQLRIAVFDFTLTDPVFIGNQELYIGTAEFALRATATILPTILIAGFLIFQGRRQSKLMGQSQVSSVYIGVVAMLIESYALESAWILVYVILFSIPHPASDFFGATLTYIEIITYLLLLYQVAKGRIYTSQDVHRSSNRRDNISSLHWNHTTVQSGLTGMTNLNTRSSGVRPEASTSLAQRDTQTV